MDSTYPMPLNRRVKKLIDGLTYQAVKSGSNWMLPLGKDAAAGEYITVDGVLGHATAAIVGGTDTIVEDTNWVPEGDGGALNALNSNLRWINLESIENAGQTAHSINIPVCNEVLINVKSAVSSITRRSCITIPYEAIAESNTEVFYLGGGWVSSAYHAFINVDFSRTTIRINNFTINGSNAATTALLEIYYR